MSQKYHSNTVYANKRPTAVMQLSRRESMLKRVFKMAINNGTYTQKEYHLFCKWAKGKSESFMLKKLGI